MGIEKIVDVPVVKQVDVPHRTTIEKIIEVPHVQHVEKIVEVPMVGETRQGNQHEVTNPVQAQRQVAPAEQVVMEMEGPSHPPVMGEQIVKEFVPPPVMMAPPIVTTAAPVIV